MPVETAELSSIASLLDQITARITSMAESAAGSHESDIATELFGIERALNGARRRVDKLVKPRR